MVTFIYLLLGLAVNLQYEHVQSRPMSVEGRCTCRGKCDEVRHSVTYPCNIIYGRLKFSVFKCSTERETYRCLPWGPVWKESSSLLLLFEVFQSPSMHGQERLAEARSMLRESLDPFVGYVITLPEQCAWDVRRKLLLKNCSSYRTEHGNFRWKRLMFLNLSTKLEGECIFRWTNEYYSVTFVTEIYEDGT